MKADTKKLVIEDNAGKPGLKVVDEQAELREELEQAKLADDWKLVASKAKELANYQAKLEALEHETKLSKLTDVANELKAVVISFIEEAVRHGQLDEAELVSFSWDMTSPLNTLTVSLLKAKATKERKATTGTGKVYNVTTESLLIEHGSKLIDGKDETYQQAWDAKMDKNSRYQIRKKLLKLAGYTS